MFSHFFIDRPIFASVLSITIFLAGLIAAFNLPLAQYPPITPPSINVTCTYPGANAHDVADSVAAPIEQQINGVENMMYMVSQSNNDGSYNLSVTFKPGVNLNFAQVLVQNRINLALPNLPDVVKQAGVITRKRNPDILMVIAVSSPNGRYDQLYLSNFTTIKIKDEIARVEGCGDVQQFGQQDYSMRVWLDPDKLSTRNMTAADVSNALREQNRQVAAGHIGRTTNVMSGQTVSTIELPITTTGRLTLPEEFENIVIRTDPSGRPVRIKDVGEVKMGARNLDSSSKVDLLPNASLAVWALPDANSIATARRVRERMDELKRSFPADIDYVVSLDLTPFIDESIKEVIHTLIEAVILVAIIVLIFLQNWRSAIIPLVAVPVAIIGTFAAMAAIGFSLNILTMFGLVLAVGIVVDDAIVVVEAVERHIEEGLLPRAAAHKAMSEVSGPVIAVALVLSAVFVPCAFISGITGQFFKQFALTIAVSTIISAFNSLTLSPALAAILLQPRGAKKDLPGRVLDFTMGWFFRAFNWTFRRGTKAYTSLVGYALRGSMIVLLVYGGLILLTWWVSNKLPVGYIPNQDQSRFYVAVQLPDAASLERTQEVVSRIERIINNKVDGIEEVKGIAHTTAIAGQSFTLNANGSNFAQFFVTLKPFDERRDPSMHAFAITDRVRDILQEQVPGAQVSLFTPPAVSGLGSASGFKIIIQDRGDLGEEELQKQIDRIIAAGNAGRFTLTEKSLARLRNNAIPAVVLTRLQALHEVEYLPKKLFEKQVDANLDQVEISADQRTCYREFIIENAESRDSVRFRFTEKSLAALRGNHTDPIPPAILTALDELNDQEFLIKEYFDNSVGDIIKKAEISDASECKRIHKLVVDSVKPRRIVGSLFSIFRANTPQLFVDVNRDQCQTMGVNPNDVFATLQMYLGSYYVNDFNRFGRTWAVVVQARGAYRDDPEKIKQLKVRNAQGDMVPLGAVLQVKSKGGPINIGRYKMYHAAAILGATQPGISSGQGIEEMEAICNAVLPDKMAFEWTEINYMQIDADKNIWNRLIFPLAVVFVFLVLAAQYESWSLPLAIILVVPMCILGSLIGVWVTGGDINIFTQIGFVVLVGLASKNAILIVEFAKHKHEEGGMSRRDATLEACRLRLRPILMTSFAFILGVVPLLITTGAGAEMRRTLGTAVFSGMLGVTLFGIFLTPVFFYVIAGFSESPLFSSDRARKIGLVLQYSLGILTLGLPWLLKGRMRREPIHPHAAIIVHKNGTAHSQDLASIIEAEPNDDVSADQPTAAS